ncbi:MAG: glycosyltransferase [Candidatus Woesebacteria bacterium]
MEKYPLVSIVIPTRDQKKENIERLLRSLIAQDYPNFEILIVGSPNDTTWQHIPSEFAFESDWETFSDPTSYSPSAVSVQIRRGAQISIVEVGLSKNHVGRDTQPKRNAGCRLAAGDYFLMTDGKIQHKTNWISQGLQILAEENAQALGGIMISTEEHASHFLALYADFGPIRRNPNFGLGRKRINKQNSHRFSTYPITSTWMMTREAYELMGGFDERFLVSYEDFGSAVGYIEKGGEFVVTNEWRVYHKHRADWRAFFLEWQRSGAGAGDLYHYFPKNGFAKKRFRSVLYLFIAMFLGLSLLFLLVLSGHPELIEAGVSFGLLAATGAGLANVRYAGGRRVAVFFPTLAIILTIIFSVSFARQYLLKDGARRLLQTIWQFTWSLILRVQT